MNERINELWEQCKTINWSIDNPEYDHEKFAELIILECSYAADEAHHKAKGFQSAGGYIREKFGVEK